MRTTLNIDDDVLKLAQRFAKGRRISIGKAVSDLVRRGATTPHRTKVVNGLIVFDLPPDSPPVTSAKVKELESEGQ
jgi:hypothetical protein